MLKIYVIYKLKKSSHHKNEVPQYSKLETEVYNETPQNIMPHLFLVSFANEMRYQILDRGLICYKIRSQIEHWLSS